MKGPSVFERIRSATAEVMARARSVRLDASGLDRLADALLAAPPEPPVLDARCHHFGSAESTLAYILTLDTLNFGSGWFPYLRKRDALSGYYTVALCLKDRFDGEGPWRAAELAEFEAEDCARVFDQDLARPEAAELMGLFAQALQHLGRFLLADYDGRFEGPVEAAGRSAAHLLELLAGMPFYADVAHYDGLEVPFYKRAQIAAADLALAFHGRGPGAFDDLDELTVFADNLVPHVLRLEGVLCYTPELLARIEAEEPLPAGCHEEIEIRAGAVHAVECLVEALARRGRRACAHELDNLLWRRGQSPAIKAHPRHRTRSVFY